MSVLGGDWRDGPAYDTVDQLTPEQAAFEALRRNLDYRADYPRLAAELAETGPPPALARWGLRFRGRSRAPRRQDTPDLASARQPTLGDPDAARARRVRRPRII